jgi:protein-tyrosine phosphatase
VVPGGEVEVVAALELDDEELGAITLGMGGYVLLESPYTEALGIMERAVFELRSRGFRIVLAHPERSPTFLRNTDALRRMVEQGVASSVSAGSLTGQFGGAVQTFAIGLLEEGLAQNVASDAHDARRRPPDLRSWQDSLGRDYENLDEVVALVTREVPAAVLSGQDLPAADFRLRRRRRRRLFGRR